MSFDRPKSVSNDFVAWINLQSASLLMVDWMLYYLRVAIGLWGKMYGKNFEQELNSITCLPSERFGNLT